MKQHPLHLGRRPVHLARRGEHAACLEPGGDGAQAACAFVLHLAQHDEHVGRALFHLAAARLPCHRGHRL